MKGSSMTRLINKLERRLGTSQMKLPDHLKKDKWGDIIKEDTLTTYSRYFPHKLLYKINTRKDLGRDGFYYIDTERLGPDVEIIGIRDLTFDSLVKSTNVNSGYMPDNIYGHFGIEDVMLSAASADLNSMYNTGIFIEFEVPNKLRITNSVDDDIARHMPNIDIEVFVAHKDLNTIEPSRMEFIEKLAEYDVAAFLYSELKFYDGIETVYATIDLKLDEWSNAKSNRDDMVKELDESYVSAANKNQPMILCI